MKKPFIIVGVILLALIIGGISYVNYQEKQIKNEAIKIDESIEKDDYITVSNILKKVNWIKLQPYSDYDLQYIQSELDLAVKYQTLFEKGEYKQYIIDYNTDKFEDDPFYSFGEKYYYQSLHEFLNNDYKKVLELSDLVNLDEINPINEEEESIIGEIAVARCRISFDKNDLDSCIDVMKENNYTDETNDILGLMYAIQFDRTGKEKDMLLHYLVELESGHVLSSPFKEEYEKLLNKYKGTEEYEYAKELQNIDYDEPIIKRPEIGMTANEVIEIWGNPIDINRTETTYGVSEQWVFFGDKYVYFEDGIVTSIQD